MPRAATIDWAHVKRQLSAADEHGLILLIILPKKTQFF